jgi:uncharacterized membrane protein YedE/YeeE
MEASWIFFQEHFLSSLIGGLIIGLAVTWMLLFNGRVTGISGIVSGALDKWNPDSFWRVSFILGLVVGGVVLRLLQPQLFEETPLVLWRHVLAGLLVGFGTVLGSGCTSGHGVCGISRLSIRSIVATIVFMTAGILTVSLLGIG